MNDDTKLREITGLLGKPAVPIVAELGDIPVILKASGLACEPKSGMRDSHELASIKDEYIFIVWRFGPDLEMGKAEARFA